MAPLMPIQINETVLAGLALFISLCTYMIGWVIADSKGKSRLTFLEEKVAKFVAEEDHRCSGLAIRLSTLENSLVRADENRQEVRRVLDRLDAQKASKDVVDGARNEVMILRADMDRRFDKLERLLNVNRDI